MQVVLLEEIEDEDAETLKEKCPVGVFDIEDIANGEVFFSLDCPHNGFCLKFKRVFSPIVGSSSLSYMCDHIFLFLWENSLSQLIFCLLSR